MKTRTALIPFIILILLLVAGPALAQGPVDHFEINAIDPGAWPQGLRSGGSASPPPPINH